MGVQAVRIIDEDGNDVDLQAYLQIKDADGNVIPVQIGGVGKDAIKVTEENSRILQEVLVALKINNKILNEVHDLNMNELDIK